MFGGWRTKNQSLTVFTYIMMIVCYKTKYAIKQAKYGASLYQNIQLTLKILKESLKYMGKTDAKYNSISSEVTGLGLFVQLPKIYSETEYKNQNAQNLSRVE